MTAGPTQKTFKFLLRSLKKGYELKHFPWSELKHTVLAQLLPEDMLLGAGNSTSKFDTAPEVPSYSTICSEILVTW